jgi:hypothetical protein
VGHSAAIRQALADTTGFEGVTGVINYPGGVGVPQKPVAIMKVVNGLFEPQTQVIPEKIPAP